MKNVFRREAVPSWAKKQQNIGIKSYSNTSCGLEHEKTVSVNYLLKKALRQPSQKFWPKILTPYFFTVTLPALPKTIL